jgi:hypothetical protein
MRFFYRVTLLGLALLGASCSDQTPSEPGLTPQYIETGSNLDQLARYQGGQVQITFGFALKAIGPQGGRIALAGFEVIVPPGAVSKTTFFTIRLPFDLSSSEFVRAQFGPHQNFAVPVTIRLPLRGTTAENTAAHILWWNGTDWEPYPTQQTDDGRIETTTMHFSEFGTEDPSKGIILVGGGK